MDRCLGRAAGGSTGDLEGKTDQKQGRTGYFSKQNEGFYDRAGRQDRARWLGSVAT